MIQYDSHWKGELRIENKDRGRQEIADNGVTGRTLSAL